MLTRFIFKKLTLDRLIKLLLLFSFLIISSIYFFYNKNIFEQIKQNDLSNRSKVQLIVEHEIQKFIFGLQGAKGVIVVENDRLDSSKFNQYARSRNYFNNFEGALGFGFIRYVKQKDFSNYKRANYLKINVYPKVETDKHFIIELIEPLNVNEKSVGLDISFENKRYKAATLAARSGEAVLSDIIQLVQKKVKNKGFLFLLPIYETAETPATEEERLSRLYGFSYAPIVLDSLLKSISDKLPSDLKIELKINNNEEYLLGTNFKENTFLKEKEEINFNLAGLDWNIKIISKSFNHEFELIVLTVLYLFALFSLFAIFVFLLKKIEVKEKLLIEKTIWLNAIVESANHMIISTNSIGTILSFNRAAEKKLGFKARELIGIHSPQVFHDKEEVVEAARKLTEITGKTVLPGFEVFIHDANQSHASVSEWTYIKKNGEKFRVKLTVTPIYDENLKLLGFVGVAEDLTKEHELSAIIENQKILMLERSKMSVLGEMAGGIAHEINTPLAIIMTLTKKISKKLSDPESLSDLVLIKETCERIDQIVKGLRIYSRNSKNDNLEKFSLKKIIDQTLSLCDEKLRNLNIKLSIIITENVNIQGRPTEISQVLLNLVNNAMDAISEEPVKEITLTVKVHDSLVSVSIADSGKGVPADIINKIFDPFYTTKDVGVGTGLGLSISKAIIKAHNGNLYYDENAFNSTFVFELPLDIGNE
ncbi:MAG: CHASE domain-containing protein [Bdellovibrionales bacterium]|nr:CHASE domain-containing protein [Bdellovibrionales bacterium]